MTESDPTPDADSPDADWRQPVGVAGRTEIIYPTGDEQRGVFAGRRQPLPPFDASCVGRRISVELSTGRLGVLDVGHGSGILAKVNPQHPGGTLLGRSLRVVLEEDPNRAGPLHRPHRWWRLTAGDSTWRWDYPGERSGHAAVTTDDGPVVHSSVSPGRIGGYSVRRLRSEWEANARPVDVLIAELVPLAGWEKSAWNRTQLALSRGLKIAVDLAEELSIYDYGPRRRSRSYFRRQEPNGGAAGAVADGGDSAPVTERAVAVVRNGSRLLVIHRRRDRRSYCVLPGGGVEPGEEPADAAIRELAEETGLRGTVRKPFYRDETERPATYFLVDVDDPDAELIITGPERARASRTNTYRPGWIELTRLGQHNLQPSQLRHVLESLD